MNLLAVGCNYGTALVEGPDHGTQHNTGPAPARDADAVAFFSDRGGFRNLYIKEKDRSPSRVFWNSTYEAITASPTCA